jgi:hypothetical protein
MAPEMDSEKSAGVPVQDRMTPAVTLLLGRSVNDATLMLVTHDREEENER